MVRQADLVEETIQEQVTSRKFGPSEGISVNSIFFSGRDIVWSNRE